jgi:hypothetical protein
VGYNSNISYLSHNANNQNSAAKVIIKCQLHIKKIAKGIALSKRMHNFAAA